MRNITHGNKRFRDFSLDPSDTTDRNGYTSDSKSHKWDMGKGEPIPVGKDLPEKKLLRMKPSENRNLVFVSGDYKGVPVQHVPTSYLNWIVRNTPRLIRGQLFRASVAELIRRKRQKVVA